MVDSIIILQMTGYDSFASSQTWLKEVTGKLLCPGCHNVYESVKGIDAVVDNDGKRRRTDLDVITCGYVQLLSTHFIDEVGAARVEKAAWLGRLYEAEGFEHERYRTAVARRDNVVVRGPKRSSIELCSDCGRLLYWPIGEQYVLRGELPREPFFLSDDNIFCRPQFYDERIRDAKLCRVGSQEVRIRDEPLDGLPGKTDELKAYVAKHGQFKRS